MDETEQTPHTILNEALGIDLSNADMVGSSEYRSLIVLCAEVVRSTQFDGGDVLEAVLGTLDELEGDIRMLRDMLSPIVQTQASAP